MKTYRFTLTWAGIVASIALASAVVPLRGSHVLVRGGSDLRLVVIAPQQEHSRLISASVLTGQPSGTVPVQRTNQSVPRYMRELLRPMGDAARTAAGGAPSVIPVVAINAEPEQRVFLPSFPLIPYLGCDVSLGVFCKRITMRDAAMVSDKSIAGIELHVGTTSLLCIRFSGWLGAIGGGFDQAPLSDVVRKSNLN